MSGIEATLMRGGTSRGVVVRLEDLAPAGPLRDRQARALIGTTTVDGLGGGSPVTDKVVLVGPPASAGADLDYIVGNVGTGGATIDWSGTCGNMTSAVLPFAGIAGLLSRTPDSGPFLLRNLATEGLVEVNVLEDTSSWPSDGVEIRQRTSYLDPGGAVFGQTLPTGRPRDVVEVDDERFEASVIDVTHPYLFLDHEQVVGARDLADPATEARIERIRGSVCVTLGRCTEASDAATLSPAVPRVILVRREPCGGADVSVRAISMGRAVASVPVTSALAVAAAVGLDGTLVGRPHGAVNSTVIVGGPTGTLAVEVDVDETGRVVSASVERTARTLMRGLVWLQP